MEQLSLGITTNEPEELSKQQKLDWLSANMKLHVIAKADRVERLEQIIMEKNNGN